MVTLSLQGTSLSDSWDISWIVGGNYSANTNCSDDKTVVTVSALAPDFSTGGGYITNKDSRGKTGINNGPIQKNNFGYDVKWTKSMTNLQGHFNTVIRSNGRAYQVKSSKPGSITVYKTTTGYRAYITYLNANIQDLTSMATGVCVPNTASALYPNCSDGSGSIILTVEDNGEPGSTGTATNDRIAITVKDKNGVLFYASNNVGPIAQMPSAFKYLVGGNIQIRSTTTAKDPNESSISTYVVVKDSKYSKTDLALQEQSLIGGENLISYPNPTSSQFNIKLESANLKDAISITVYSINGKVVEKKQNLTAGQIIQLGASYRLGVYILEMIQGNLRKELKLVKTPD
jgi:hypothetical protein